MELRIRTPKERHSNEPETDTDGSKAVEWFVEHPYEFVRAYVEGYTVEPEEPNKKFYWRKKKEHLAWFEDEENSYLTIRPTSGTISLNHIVSHKWQNNMFTEQEARDLLKDDFDMFEKVEVE